MDTDTRIAALESRIKILEDRAAEAQEKMMQAYETAKRHPLFGQVVAQFGKILG